MIGVQVAKMWCVRFPSSHGKLLGSTVCVVVESDISKCLAAPPYLVVRAVRCLGLVVCGLVPVVVIRGDASVFVGTSSSGGIR